MQDFEKLGVFYLGRQYDLAARKAAGELVLYDSKDLTTHAVCVGMTGSGKTGLCLALLEEAAIDGVPAICIDPKGDLGNLLLTFPDLRPEDFAPWIDPGEPVRQGLSTEQYAARTAETWKKGLAEWGQDGARIRRFRDACDLAIYTPGSTAGLPLAVMRSLSAPGEAVRRDAEAFRDRVGSCTAGLLALLGIDADPIRSRESILVSNLLDRTWREGKDLDLPGLIRSIQSPPFDRIGVLDLETVFPAADRFALAMQLNNLLGSPGFAGWMAGEPLDVARLLHTPQGKPRLSIVSIAHLSDAERMFFVTILLGEVLAWMRAQPGTSSLRALLYMDEVFGYFPPTANPPSKTPMLTLLKQARAYGLGVVLATQNPVDLDYKGLSNAGTWFLGRLQTERDKARVLDGLEGASTAAGHAFDRAAMEATLSSLGNRVFLMNNVHDDRPVVFQSRWALSYLRGPLTREQIRTLMADRTGAGDASGEAGATANAAAPSAALDAALAGARPVLPPGITETFFAARATGEDGQLVLRPALLGTARVRFAQTKGNIDHWEEVALLAEADDSVPADPWSAAESLDAAALDCETAPGDEASFAALPKELARPAGYKGFGTALKDHLYRTKELVLWSCQALKAVSQPGESEGDFRVRLSDQARERRDLEVEKLRKKYGPKLATLHDRIRRAEQKVEKEKSQRSQRMFETVLSIGSGLLGAVLGNKLASATNVGRATSAVRSASRVAQEHGDIGDAVENVEAIQAQVKALEAEFAAETQRFEESTSPDRLALEELRIKPKKTDVTVSGVTLAWIPYRAGTAGRWERAAP